MLLQPYDLVELVPRIAALKERVAHWVAAMEAEAI